MTELVAAGTNAIGRESKLLSKVWQNSCMTTHRHKSGLFTGVLAFLFATSAWSQSATSYPDMPIDARTMRVLEQAEEVYERADYKRAFFIYRKELAPMGDKYGQYMVGFMYRAGQGVEEDQVAASAWYRLAAERGTPEFVGARDEVMQSLDEGQRSESDSQFVELRKRYGDLILLTRAIREDHQLLQSKSGSTGDAGEGSMICDGAQQPGCRFGGDIAEDQASNRCQTRLHRQAHRYRCRSVRRRCIGSRRARAPGRRRTQPATLIAVRRRKAAR